MNYKLQLSNSIMCVILILSLITSLSACGRYNEYNNIDQYDVIFKEFGASGEIYFLFPHSDEEDSEIFLWYCQMYKVDDNKTENMKPPVISSLNVIDFYADFTEHIIGNPFIEILLIIQYDEVTIEKEIDRLSNLSVSKTALYDSEYFPLPAYITRASTHTYSYALVDNTKYTISYIYVQHKDLEDINTIKSLLPRNYANSTLNDFSIFEY